MFALPSASLAERLLMPIDGKTAHTKSYTLIIYNIFYTYEHWGNSIKDKKL